VVDRPVDTVAAVPAEAPAVDPVAAVARVWDAAVPTSGVRAGAGATSRSSSRPR
jgi:hypothetical protein